MLTAPVRISVAGTVLLKASSARTWNSLSDARICRTGPASTRYWSVRREFSCSARDELTTPRIPPARATSVSTVPSRTMARWGEYQRQRSRAFGFDPLLTV